METFRRWDIHERVTLAACLLVTILAIAYGLLSTGTYTDDDIAHYLIAKYSWKHPSLFLYTWGRPAFTILYAPAALLGFDAVRVFSALLAGVVCLLAARAAKLYGVRWYWLAALLTGFQPEFLRQGFSSLTQLTFMLLLCGSLIAYRKQRWAWMAFLAGWMPLARYESVPIVIVLAALLLQVRKPALLLLLAGPFAIHNVYHAVELGTASALLFPLDQVMGVRPGANTYNFEPGHPLHYIRLMPTAFGWVALLLALWGAVRSRFGLLQLSVLLLVGVVSVIQWRFPHVGIPPDWPLYLSICCPAVGILAAVGFEKIFRGETAKAWGIGVLVAAAVMTLIQVRPFQITRERIMASEAGRWFITGEYRDRLVLGSHVWFYHSAGLDRFDEKVSQRITPDNLRAAPDGTIVVWDSHYSHRLQYKTPLRMLTGNPQCREIRRWENGRTRIIVFEKLTKPGEVPHAP
jgi:hypothetical protein